MSFPFRVLGAFFFILALGACASPGTEAPGGEVADPVQTQEDVQDVEEEDLPQWVQALPEGTPPEENEPILEAFVLITQAQSAQANEEEARAQDFWSQVLAKAEESIALEPDNAMGYYMAGEALFELGEYEEAAARFDEAEEIFPRYAYQTEYFREYAWVEYFNEGIQAGEQSNDPSAGLPFYEQAHAVYQGRPEAMMNIADAYLRAERHEDAEEVYAQAIDVMTGPRAADAEASTLEAWDEYMDVARFNRAQALYQLERYAEAAEIYEEIYEEDPENLQAGSSLAVTFSAMGEAERAQAIYDQMLNQPGLGPSDYFTVGVGLYQAEAFDQAAVAFGQVWELVPLHRDAAFYHSQMLFLAEDFEPLVDAAARAKELDPRNQLLFRFRQQALDRLEREEELVAEIEALEELTFILDDLQFQPVQGGAIVDGFVVNRTMEPGTSVDVQFHFIDVDGNELGTTDAQFELAAPGDRVNFQVEYQTSAPVFGYYYEVL
ncbi:MAG: tetratricopeptide repeat protein [Gemmatimonadota bacterium]